MAYSLANNFAPSDSDDEAPKETQSGSDPLGDGGSKGGRASKGEGPPHEEKEDTVLDFEKDDGSTMQERELHIFALPLYWNPDVPPEENLVFLPVSRFNEDGRIREGWQGKVKERIENLQGAAAERWAKLKEKEEGTFGARVYKAGQRALNDMSIEERLTRNIPKNVSKVSSGRDFRLDKYYEGVQCSADGVMHEQDVEDMLAEIHEEGLLDALLELRKRRLREQPTCKINGEKYNLLPSSGS
ncbi:hypothetical protein DUNSADRAFT_1283 [Dunaliella salina]|uniref:Uncharacterized protein n=1 Tax=Dunaliella salina TaxID=3046 RepID=A0ABQ7GXB8_DUNSA|nr:hypothetical protein DUNSADRAFT_1283 [Dunaliella salina]|eukprot:KAF5839249.1 hypothetical protein DUNSADRAFT_1283 [Dunaliella salina]